MREVFNLDVGLPVAFFLCPASSLGGEGHGCELDILRVRGGDSGVIVSDQAVRTLDEGVLDGGGS